MRFRSTDRYMRCPEVQKRESFTMSPVTSNELKTLILLITLVRLLILSYLILAIRSTAIHNLTLVIRHWLLETLNRPVLYKVCY